MDYSKPDHNWTGKIQLPVIEVENSKILFSQDHITRHIVEVCPLMKFSRSIEKIHTASADAIKWMKNIDVRLWLRLHQTKKIN